MNNFDRKPFEEQKLLWHLTSLENLEGIIQYGLLPRSSLSSFEDVANHEIIARRSEYNLEHYVPFHFFCSSPFAGDVQKTHREKEFVYICLPRVTARAQGFLILPKHPVTLEEVILYNYDAGFEKIDWATMNLRKYSDDHCKHVCMAECITPNPVMPTSFQSIKVKTQRAKTYIQSLFDNRLGFNPCYIDIEPHRFIKME